MSVLRSARRGDRLIGRGDAVLALLAAWLGPGMAGLAVILALFVVGQVLVAAGAGDARAGVLGLVWFLGWALFFSPVLSWAGLLLGAPLVWLLLRAGAFGWAPAALAGGTVGWVLSGPGALQAEVTAPFGALASLLLRAVLAGRRPEAFRPG